MKRLVITRPTVIRGRDLWGRAAHVTLEPAGKPGWFLYAGGRDVELEPSMVRLERHRLVLTHGDVELQVFEHLGALRFTGLDGIRIKPGTTWLPYGTGEVFWRAI